jgi:heat shock protein HslJ
VSDTERPRFSRLAIAAVVLVLLLAACGDEPDLVGTGNDASVPLAGTEWQLVEASIGGSTTAVAAEVDAVVRFDGDGAWSAHACNHIGGSVEVDGVSLAFDDDTTSTLVGCAEPVGSIDSAITTVLQGDVDAAIAGEELRLTREGGDWLRLEVRDGIFPSRTMTPLDEGTRGEGDYRFGYEAGEGRPYVSWEFRSAAGKPWGFAGSGPPSDPHRPDPLDVAVGESASFVFGIIGADVARLTYERPSGEVSVLGLFPLAEFPEWRTYGGFVEQPATGSYVVAYDAAGAELGRSIDLR